MENIIEAVNDLPLEEFKKFLTTENLTTLHNLKTHLDDIYYNTGDSTVDDIRYDMLKDVIKKRDPLFVAPVGATLRTGENRVELPFWLGSQDKITPDNTGEFSRWLQKNKADDYLVTEKLDGVSCLLISNGKKISLYTRGDGIIGADISYLVPYFRTIPTNLTEIAVRGELILKKKVFLSKYKDKTISGRSYKNPRNMVAGLIGAKTSRQGLEDVNFVAYEIVGNETMPKPSQQLSKLTSLGFSVANHELVPKLTFDVLARIFMDFRNKSQYELDGIVVQSNTSYDRNTNGNPEYAFAFKMLSADSIFETTVNNIEWNASKWGQLKPVVLFDPVEANGVTMERATAHNAKYVEENKLGPGAVIRITRSKEVIPYIVSVVRSAKNPQMPSIPYVWDATHVNISVKIYDDTMCVKLVSNFFSKLGIKHVSEATVSKMFTNGLDNLLKIVGASKQRLLEVPEFGEKSAERIYTNIHNGLQNVKIPIVLGASGVFGFGIGRKRMEMLFLDIPDLLKIYKTHSESKIKSMILNVEGFSDIIADKVVKNLKYADLFIQKLGKYATFQDEKRVSESMKGQKFVMTGFRSKELEENIASRGGKVTGSVSKNTTALIVAKKEAKLTGKAQKAQELNIPIYLKEDFIKQFIE